MITKQTLNQVLEFFASYNTQPIDAPFKYFVNYMEQVSSETINIYFMFEADRHMQNDFVADLQNNELSMDEREELDSQLTNIYQEHFCNIQDWIDNISKDLPTSSLTLVLSSNQIHSLLSALSKPVSNLNKLRNNVFDYKSNKFGVGGMIITWYC